MFKKTLIAMAFFPLLLSSTALAYPHFVGGEQIVSTQNFDDDTFLSGNVVEVTHDVVGDLKVVGGKVSISGNVSGSVYAAGGDVTIRGKIGGSLYTAGGDITINAIVAKNAYIGGGTVSVEKGTVAQNVFLGSGNVIWNGTSETLVTTADKMTFGGKVTGKMSLKNGTSFTALPGAEVVGDFTFQSRTEPQFDRSFVQGKFTAEKMNIPEMDREQIRSAFGAMMLVLSLFGFIMSLVFGLIVLARFPNLLHTVAQTLTNNAPRMIGKGFVVAVVWIALIIAAFISLVGIKLGIVLLSLLVVFTAITTVINGYVMGFWFMRGKPYSRGRTFLFYILGAVAYTLISLIPILGGILALILSLMSTGALWTHLMTIYAKLRHDALV